MLPTQLTGITTTHHDKSEKASLPQMEELTPASTERINVTERQRRLIPYMTFYLTRNFNRPSNQLQEPREPPPPQQQYQLLPPKINLQPYPGKILLENYQPPTKYEQQKYQEPAPTILYQPKNPYTPFLESNKLPGGFTPMRGQVQLPQPIRIQVLNPSNANPQHQLITAIPVTTKEPNFSLIFDKLLQLKQLQYNKPPPPQYIQQPERPGKINIASQYFTPRPGTKFITIENYGAEPEIGYKQPVPIKEDGPKYITIENYSPQDLGEEIRYKPAPAVKTKFIAIEDYPNPEEISYKVPATKPADNTRYVTVPVEQHQQPQPERYKPTIPTKTYFHTYTPAQIDVSNNENNKVQSYENFESLKTYNQIPAPPRTVAVKLQSIPQQYQHVELQTIQPIDQSIQQQEYEEPHTQTNEPILVQPVYRQPIIQTPTVPIKSYRPIYHQPEVTHPPPQTSYTATENPHSLSVILKQLQESNTLPHTLTPDNIDNSIKTLVHILNALKHTQKFQKPIVVASQSEEDDEADVHHQETEEASGYENSDEDAVLPEAISNSYPANTPEGGTPGKPGIDYPAHSFIPQTDFNCKKQRYKGFFGDPDTSCQVLYQNSPF